MIRQTYTIMHKGKPVPGSVTDHALPASVRVPSKREAEHAFNVLQEAAVDSQEIRDAIAVLNNFLETR